MTFAGTTNLLFDQTEEMVKVRHRLFEILQRGESTVDRTLTAFAIKQIDIVRMMVLYEYELLDTAHIVSKEYLSSYCARRIEIIRMTVEQIRGHRTELTELAGHMRHHEVREAVERAAESITMADRLLGRIINELEQYIITEKNNDIIH